MFAVLYLFHKRVFPRNCDCRKGVLPRNCDCRKSVLPRNCDCRKSVVTAARGTSEW